MPTDVGESTTVVNDSSTSRFTYSVDQFAAAPDRVRIQVAFATTPGRTSVNLQGPLNQHWLVLQPLQLTVAQDMDGWFIVSDDIFFVYGDGPTLPQAWEDYRTSLAEYCEMVRDDAGVSDLARAQYDHLRSIIQPCRSEN